MKKINFKNPLVIYFTVLLGLAAVVGSVYMVVEVMSRLQPENQVLAFGEEETTYVEPILKIYAWELVPDEENIAAIEALFAAENLNTGTHSDEYDNTDKEINKIILREMISDEPLRVGEIDKAYPDWFFYGACSCCHNREWTDDLVSKSPDSYDFINYMDTSVTDFVTFIAEADAELHVEVTSSNVNSGFKETDGDYLDNSNLRGAVNDKILTRDTLMLSHYINLWGKNGEHLSNRGVEPEQSQSEGEMLFFRRDTQRLGEVYPKVTGEDAYVRREVVESAIIFYAYDKTNPEKLIARAEIRVTQYGKWQFEKIDPIDHCYSLKLYTLGINSPDAHGYTEAVLYDYWQADDWS